MSDRTTPKIITNDSRRLFIKLMAGTTIGLLTGCGGGGSTSSTGTSTDTTDVMAALYKMSDELSIIAVNDPSVSGEGQIHLKLTPSNYYVVVGTTWETPTESFESYFSDEGRLERVSNLKDGSYTLVSTQPDHIEYRNYNAAASFVDGFVIYAEGNKIFLGDLSQDFYASPSDLINVSDVTVKIKDSIKDVLGSDTILSRSDANLSIGEVASYVLPISIAYADDQNSINLEEFEKYSNLDDKVNDFNTKTGAEIIGFLLGLAGRIKNVLGLHKAINKIKNIGKTNYESNSYFTDVLRFTGTYLGTEMYDGVQHTQNNLVGSDGIVTINQTFAGGSFSCVAGRLDNIKHNGPIAGTAEIFGEITINNMGIRKAILRDAKITIDDFGQAEMFWSGKDTKFEGGIGGTSHRPQT